MFFIFEKRKSRKQLLQEIEELKEKNNICLNKEKLIHLFVEEHVKSISATCISYDNDIENVKKCLCDELAKKIMPYVKIETYKIAEEYCSGENKHFTTITIVAK